MLLIYHHLGETMYCDAGLFPLLDNLIRQCFLLNDDKNFQRRHSTRCLHKHLGLRTGIADNQFHFSCKNIHNSRFHIEQNWFSFTVTDIIDERIDTGLSCNYNYQMQEWIWSRQRVFMTVNKMCIIREQKKTTVRWSTWSHIRELNRTNVKITTLHDSTMQNNRHNFRQFDYAQRQLTVAVFNVRFHMQNWLWKSA